MKPGQRMTRWWQKYVLGRFRSPQDLLRAARSENPGAQASDRFFGLPDDDGWLAPVRLKADVFTSAMYLGQCDRADWQFTDLRLQRWAALFIEMARRRGIPLYVHCAFRSEEEQRKVNHAGNSKAAYPRSPHNIGEAVDVVHSVFHWDLTRQEWHLLHVLGRLALDRLNADLPAASKLKLAWGGDFKSLWDPAHWEISDYRARIRRLPVGPPVRYTPRAILARVKL